LCAGTNGTFTAGTADVRLSDSGGPGFQFLTILDMHKLAGKILCVLREVGSLNSQFTIKIYYRFENSEYSLPRRTLRSGIWGSFPPIRKARHL